MTNTELIRLLQKFPPNMETHMEVRGHTGIPTDIDWETGGVSSWLIITDYKITPQGKQE